MIVVYSKDVISTEEENIQIFRSLEWKKTPLCSDDLVADYRFPIRLN